MFLSLCLAKSTIRQALGFMKARCRQFEPDKSVGPDMRFTGSPAFTLSNSSSLLRSLRFWLACCCPAYPEPQASALRVACASNLRQIGVALRLYVDDFQKYPAFNVLLSSTSRSNFWDNKLLPYAGGNQGLFLCSANTTVKGNVSSNWCFDDPTDQLCPNRPKSKLWLQCHGNDRESNIPGWRVPLSGVGLAAL